MMCENIPLKIADKYQEFFNFMLQEHNLTLTISEMEEIRVEVEKLNKDLEKKF
jgi:hypothetical protein